MARVRGYDALRGLSVISMVGFHLCYDLVFLEGYALEWFKPPFQDVWRASISWTFLALAGIMCSYSRSNLRRGVRYLAAALAIFVVTTVAAVDIPISFGIIYCMGFSTVLAWGIQALWKRSGLRRPTKACLVAMAIVLFAAFLLCLGLPTGTFGLKAFGGPYLRAPVAPYASGMLSWLGFPGPGFASGDYYPPLPYTLMFLVGACLGRFLLGSKAEGHLASLTCPPLEIIGRHAMLVYLVHQPILLVLTGLL